MPFHSEAIRRLIEIALNRQIDDCFAYALAKDASAPLLFKGDDFGQKDVMVAPY